MNNAKKLSKVTLLKQICGQGYKQTDKQMDRQGGYYTVPAFQTGPLLIQWPLLQRFLIKHSKIHSFNIQT